MSDYDDMRRSDDYDDDGVTPEERLERINKKSDKDEYFDFYDDIKTSLKDDW